MTENKIKQVKVRNTLYDLKDPEFQQYKSETTEAISDLDKRETEDDLVAAALFTDLDERESTDDIVAAGLFNDLNERDEVARKVVTYALFELHDKIENATSDIFFIAEYGVTTGDEIASALEEGKIPICFYTDDYDIKGTYVCLSDWHGDDRYYFICFQMQNQYSVLRVDEGSVADWTPPYTSNWYIKPLSGIPARDLAEGIIPKNITISGWLSNNSPNQISFLADVSTIENQSAFEYAKNVFLSGGNVIIHVDMSSAEFYFRITSYKPEENDPAELIGCFKDNVIIWFDPEYTSGT